MKNISVLTLLFVVFCISLNAQDKKDKPAFCKDSIKLVEMEPFTYIAYEQTGSHNKMNPAFTKLWEECTKQFLAYDNAFFSVLYNSPAEVPEDSLRWDVATKLNEDDEIVEPLKKKEWNYKKVVKAQYEGPFDNMGVLYTGTIEWINENGYQIIGPNVQRFLRSPRPNKDGVLVGKIEIWYPVTEMKK
jgi:AraC family transcriptional regulator